MKLNIFCSTKQDGIMSNNKKFFPTLKLEERKLLCDTTIKRFINKTNIQYKNIIIINEKNNILKSKIATEKLNAPKENMIVLKETTPNIIVAVETSDSPIIVATAQNEEGKKTSIISLASIENINKDILTKMVDNLMQETDVPPFEMTFYIGPCPNKENYKLENIEQLTNKIWNGTYTKKKGKYYLDLRYAIFNQLLKEIVDPNNIYFDSTDTTTSNKYFSELMNDNGRQIECVVYTNE